MNAYIKVEHRVEEDQQNRVVYLPDFRASVYTGSEPNKHEENNKRSEQQHHQSGVGFLSKSQRKNPDAQQEIDDCQDSDGIQDEPGLTLYSPDEGKEKSRTEIVGLVEGLEDNR
jgi:hypothetical protein